MAVPYTTREVAKKIAEEVLKEHGGGGGGSSYTAGNGIKIENNEIEVDDTVVATIDSEEILGGAPVISNVKGLVGGNQESGLGAFVINQEEGVVPMPTMLATSGSDLMYLFVNATPGGGFSSGPMFAQNTEGDEIYSDIPVMEFTILTFIKTSSGVECPLPEGNRRYLFKRIKTQVEEELYQLPICQLMSVEESETGKRVIGTTSTVSITYESDPNRVLFEFSEEGTYELLSDGTWRGAE